MSVEVVMGARFAEYGDYDGLGLAELVRRGEITPREILEEAISRIDGLNPDLNAVIYHACDEARNACAEALPGGPFTGVPLLLKDLRAECAGMPLHCGSRFHRGYVSQHDSELVKRFKSAGAAILGKTNTPEYGLMPVTEPELYGPTRNPWDLSRTPGGSSGGSAAAVGAGMVPIAHGSDGAGSIRIPASCCGVFGLKPTRGRNSCGDDFHESWGGLACEHVLTRSVRDSAAMLDATAAPQVDAPYYLPPRERPFLQEVEREPGRLRIAFTSKPFLPSAVHADCRAALDDAVELCRDLGHDPVEASPEIDTEAGAAAFLTIVCCQVHRRIELAASLMDRKPTFRDFEPETWALNLLGRRCRASEYLKAVQTLQRTARDAVRFFNEYDVLLTPTLSSPPAPIGSLKPDGVQALAVRFLGELNSPGLIEAFANMRALSREVFKAIPFTPPFNATGQPAMSVPLYWNDEGLPIGVQFVGRFSDEATLFRLAGQLERARPWFHRRPRVPAA